MQLGGYFLVLSVVTACSSGSDASGSDAPGLDAGSTTEDSGVGGGSGGSGGSTAADGGVASAGRGGASGGGGAIALPAGSRELDGIVNLVDTGAATQLESFVRNPTPEFITLRHGLTQALNVFLRHYEEAYDFVYFFTDHAVSGAAVAGRFEAVTRPAAPGGVSEYEIAAEGYQTTGRVKGVAAFPYNAGVHPPLAHETLHYWGVDLDARFGFGTGLDASSSHPLHWGYASINGQLGGFDPSTLRCQTPAGALPPNCTALAGGRIRYVTGSFAPQSNVFRGVPYAPLELYLMGLLPGTQVPTPITMLTAARVVSSSSTSVVVEASGLRNLGFSEITARHGSARLLAAGARHFTSAFVVVSAAPAPDAVLREIASYAAVFGKRRAVSGWSSFEEHTGGRATMNTRLGARRAAGTNPPPPRRALTCDPLAQNCSRAELGCYMAPPAVCALSGRVARDQPCNAIFACAPGLDCVSGPSNPDSFFCKPYCDPNNAAAASACAKLCPVNHLTIRTTDGVVAGLCQPN